MYERRQKTQYVGEPGVWNARQRRSSWRLKKLGNILGNANLQESKTLLRSGSWDGGSRGSLTTKINDLRTLYHRSIFVSAG